MVSGMRAWLALARGRPGLREVPEDGATPGDCVEPMGWYNRWEARGSGGGFYA